jgi:hypothetical protein
MGDTTMLNLSGKTNQEALDQIIEIIEDVSHKGSLIFEIDRNPEFLLKEIWKETHGKFNCLLLEQTGEHRKVRIDPPKTCCGICI